MKIAYVGNRKNLDAQGKSFNTEAHITLSLEKLGHEVNFIQEDEITAVGLQLPARVYGADIFLWTRTWPGIVTETDLKTIHEQGIPTVSFHLDKYAGIQRDGGMGIGSPFWKTDFVFSPEGSVQSQKIFKNLGINQYYLPAGVYEDECIMLPRQGNYIADVCFIGGGETYSHPEWAYRHKLVRWLKENYGGRYIKYGYPEKTIRGLELNQLYSNVKIVIGDSLCKDFTDSYYYSDRPFEVTGRGGMIIMPYIPGITDHFVDRKEAVLYAFDNFIQLKNLIDYYILHDDEREQIRIAGFERTKRENTYTHRCKEMLRILKEYSINDAIKARKKGEEALII
jgi:hypothetical protein